MNSSKSFFFGLSVCLILGAIAGTIAGLFIPPKFQSRARFHVELLAPDNAVASIVDVANARHDRLIDSAIMIERAAELDSLFKLKAYDSLTKQEAIQAIDEGLQAQEIEKGVYEVQMTGTNSVDTQVVTNSIMNNYANQLKISFEAGKARLAAIAQIRLAQIEEAESRGHSIDLDDGSAGFQPIEYSFKILAPATPGIPIQGMFHIILMGAGLGAAAWLILFLLFRMLGWYSLIPLLTAWVGLCAGFGMYYFSSPIFESTGSFLISPRHMPTDNTPKNIVEQLELELAAEHEMMFVEPQTVSMAVHNNDLEKLDCFAGVPSEEIPEFVIQNLLVKQDENEKTLFHATFRGENSRSVQIVLQCLINSYRDRLNEEAQERYDSQVVEDRKQYEKATAEGVPEKELVKLQYDLTIDGQGRDRRQLREMGFWNLNSPALGRKIAPTLISYLLYGPLAGYMLGLALASVIRGGVTSKSANENRE